MDRLDGPRVSPLTHHDPTCLDQVTYKQFCYATHHDGHWQAGWVSSDAGQNLSDGGPLKCRPTKTLVTVHLFVGEQCQNVPEFDLHSLCQSTAIQRFVFVDASSRQSRTCFVLQTRSWFFFWFDFLPSSRSSASLPPLDSLRV